MRVSCIPVLVAARSRECTAESYLETGLRYRVVNDLGLRKADERPVHVSSTYQDFVFFFCLLTYVTTVKTEIKESMNDAQFVLTLSRSHTGSTLARTYVCKAEKSLTRLTSKVL